MTGLHRTAGSLSIFGVVVVTLTGSAGAQRVLPEDSRSVSDFTCAAYPGPCRPSSRLLDSSRFVLNYLCGDDPANCADRTPPPSEDEIWAIKHEIERIISLLESLEPIDEELQLRADLSRFCDRDPATCISLVRGLMREGDLDGDRDGVLDLNDTCLATPSPLAHAQSILLSQELALTEAMEILERAFRLALTSANGTVSSRDQELLAEQVGDLYFELLAVANSASNGRFLFGGRVDHEPPFQSSGTFSRDSMPTISYEGDEGRWSLPIDRSGDEVAVTIPGGSLFLGDLDGDGVFPDPDRADVFAFLAEGYVALRSVASANAYMLRFRPATRQLLAAARENSELFARARRVFANPENVVVDAAGCSQDQFCRNVRLNGRRGWRACERSDFLNDEPLRRQPRDCRVRFSRNSGPHCIADRAGQRRSGSSSPSSGEPAS